MASNPVRLALLSHQTMIIVAPMAPLKGEQIKQPSRGQLCGQKMDLRHAKQHFFQNKLQRRH